MVKNRTSCVIRVRPDVYEHFERLARMTNMSAGVLATEALEYVLDHTKLVKDEHGFAFVPSDEKK